MNKMSSENTFYEVKRESSFEERNIQESENFDYQNENQTIDDAPMDTDQLADSCCLCPEGYKMQNLLIEHLQAEHQNDADANYSIASLQCCNCSEGIQLQVELINHMLSHFMAVKCESEKVQATLESLESEENEEEIEDESLDEKKRSKPSYHKQYNRRDRSPNTQKIQQEFTRDLTTKLFYCNFCRNGYKHKQTVERHLSKEHNPIKSAGRDSSTNTNQQGFTLEPETRTFFCNICRNGYKQKQTIERHLLKEHNLVLPKTRLIGRTMNLVKEEGNTADRTRKEKNLICDLCGQHFLFRESLRKHLLRHVEPAKGGSNSSRTAREKIVCDQCTKLVDPSLMKRHTQVHHSDYRPFRCEELGCKTSFFDITKFNDHKNIHLKVKPYVCEFCQESFHYASNWRQHKLRHTDPDRFKCSVCSHCFVSTKSLRLHMRLHIQVDPDAPKPFACSHDGCDKAFRYLDRLKLHVFNVHRQEPENKCELCSFVTHRKKYHKRHMLKVHKIREGNPRTRVFPVSQTDI